MVDATADYPLHPEGILKHDPLSGVVELWNCGPDPSDTAEDAGWLLSMVYNRAEDLSELVILDARAAAAGPIARVKMPQRVPFGFHDLWVPTDVQPCRVDIIRVKVARCERAPILQIR